MKSKWKTEPIRHWTTKDGKKVCDLELHIREILSSYEILANAFHGYVYYAAVRRRDDINNPVEAIVILTKVFADDTHFSYKLMPETMNPFYYNCPMHILDILTPTENEKASKWREICREKHIQKQKMFPYADEAENVTRILRQFLLDEKDDDVLGGILDIAFGRDDVRLLFHEGRKFFDTCGRSYIRELYPENGNELQVTYECRMDLSYHWFSMDKPKLSQKLESILGIHEVLMITSKIDNLA